MVAWRRNGGPPQFHDDAGTKVQHHHFPAAAISGLFDMSSTFRLTTRRLAIVTLAGLAVGVSAASAALLASTPGAEGAERHHQAQTVTTVILVRHAEKAEQPANDPPLTEQGIARAKSLLQVVRDAGVNAIVTTQFQRTRLTAKPAADSLGITPDVVEARGANHPAAVAAFVREKHAGKTVLVVGHSNTIPEIVAALGAPHPGIIGDPTHDNLFIVTLDASGKAKLVRAKY
jgi:broad specificity phosphatase PhoE